MRHLVDKRHCRNPSIRDEVRMLCNLESRDRETSSSVCKRLRRQQWQLSSQSKTTVGYGFFSQTFYQNLLFRVNVYNNYNLQLRWVDDKYK